MMEIGFLVVFNALVAGFWSWVCFRGGDRKWCDQIKRFWRGGAYTWLKPWHCKAFASVFLAALLAGDVGIMLSRLR
jgi:hypothetical protein